MNGYVKVLVAQLLSGLIGCALIAYPTYDREGTLEATLPLASVFGPLALSVGVVHIASEGYTTIRLKEGNNVYICR